MTPTYFLLYFSVVSQFNSSAVFGQRAFANQAVSDSAPYHALVTFVLSCCCDPDCTADDPLVSPVCKSTQTTSSYLSSQEQNLQTWNCSNTTSNALYDYFPFVCVQVWFYHNVTFTKTGDDVVYLPSTFISTYSELFQSTTLPTTTTTAATVIYLASVPIRRNTSTLLTLPGNLVGSICQDSVSVLLGVNRDVTCTPSTSLCTTISSLTSVQSGGGPNSNVNVIFFQKAFTTNSTNRTDLTAQYYFPDSYILTIDNINNIQFVNGSAFDYNPSKHHLTRTQRYFSACSCTSGFNTAEYQTYSGCLLRDNFAYTGIPSNFFNARPSSDDATTNFADFNGAANATSITCLGTNIRRVFYRFNYSSVDNTISTVEAFVLLQTSTATTRITIEWNDIAVNPATNTTIPRGYQTGEVLQFRQNDNISDVSSLVPTSNGYCIDATRKILRYKQGFSSQCFIQLTQSTIKSCHTLKLNMYLYLNVFSAPASHVLAYSNANATQIPIRDDTQDSLDLDRIDKTRSNNRLTTTYIVKTQLNQSIPTAYDTAETLTICFDVPSGICIEFDYVRVSISPTVSFERMVSVRYNYTYSTLQFDCTAASCANTTQKYLVTFQSAFVDYTNAALNISNITKADITSADNYFQHLLWLITPEYKGEPGYRNYTIAMILIFIAISAVVIHILLFGIMYPF